MGSTQSLNSHCIEPIDIAKEPIAYILSLHKKATVMKRPRPMKTIGILGGMSDQAPAEYYRMINKIVNNRL